MKELLNRKEYMACIEDLKASPWEEPGFYKQWLAQTYYYVCHSTRLTAYAAAKLHVDDPLFQRMLHHTEEEEGHHLLAIRDLKEMGSSIEDYPELPLTKVFYQSQYYKVDFEHPYHLLGQVVMLEAAASIAGEYIFHRVEKAFGKKTASFWEVHAFEDVKHIDKALEACEKTNPQQQKGITDNFLQATDIYHRMIKSFRIN